MENELRPETANPPAVVVINDDLAQLNLFDGLLQKMGCRTRLFRSAGEALKALAGKPSPDLLVTDLYMPGIDGWRFCGLVRSPEFSGLNETPVLVTSATYAGDEAASITAALGANAFLSVPVDGPKFVELVRTMLNGGTPSLRSRVLVVEDDPDLIQLIRDGFEAHGYLVEAAQSTAEALAKWRAQRPEVVVLDYRLPDGLGDTMLAELRAGQPSPAVIMITGDPRPNLAADWVSKGASAYVRKPFDVDYLIHLCERTRRERALLRVEDILEQRTRELREEKEKFAKAFRLAPLFLTISELESGTFVEVNDKAVEASGFTREELIGCTTVKLGLLTAEDRARVLGILRQHGRISGLELTLKAKSGRAIPCLFHGEVILVNDRQHLLSVAVDITERRQLEEQLRQAQKMEAVGQLAGGVAHDFNNILTAILMQVGVSLQDPALTPQLRTALHQLERGANRAASLTRQLLAFSRRQILQVKPLDLHELLADLLKMLRRLLGEHIDLMFQGQTAPLWLEADAGMIEQVVMNLCVNARDAMPKGGRLTIRTLAVELDAAAAQANPEARPGRFVCLTVADTGCGMDPSTQQRIFEPFFTTKDVGQGTGLGLATVYGIVKQHQGWIEVESAVGQGSVFRVFLPACDGPPVAASHAAPVQAPHGRETILVVEDDESVRRLAAVCLRHLGYQVLEAANGMGALQQWNNHTGQIGLLLTDVVMPQGLSGLELAEQLRQMNPRLKVILSSGYSLEMNRLSPSALKGMTFLAKPYEADTLGAVVRKCLDEA